MRRDSPASGWGYLPLAGECPQFTEGHEAFRHRWGGQVTWFVTGGEKILL
jgi:hypothetical protein